MTGQERVNVSAAWCRSTYQTGAHLMSATGYPLSRIQTRRPSMIELLLALSVIAGLAFVTLRVKNMTPPEPRPQTVEQAMAVVKSATAPVPPDSSDNKNP